MYILGGDNRIRTYVRKGTAVFSRAAYIYESANNWFVNSTTYFRRGYHEQATQGSLK